MAAFYLDSDVSVRLAPLLREAGHDAVTADSQGRRQATDDLQFLAATQQRRIIVTHNRKDFVLLHDAWHTWQTGFDLLFPSHAGILVLDQRREPELATAIVSVIERSLPLIPTNSLFWWRYPDEWLVRLPTHTWRLYP